MSTAISRFAFRPLPACIGMLTASLVAGAAQAADPPAQSTAAGTSNPAPIIESRAMDALKNMGAHLRGLKTFALHADTTIDDVNDDGQKLQFGGTIDTRVRAPDHLRIDIDSDRRQRSYYYDGKTLTQYAPRMGYYATFNAPSTIRELVGVLDDKYDISLPLADLFLWGTKDGDGSAITAASFVGPGKIAGQECDQYAFRQPEADWQVWISAQQLPCKLVITTMDEASQPQYTAVFTWHVDAKPTDKDFVFVPPKAAHKIEIAVADATAH